MSLFKYILSALVIFLVIFGLMKLYRVVFREGFDDMSPPNNSPAARAKPATKAALSESCPSLSPVAAAAAAAADASAAAAKVKANEIAKMTSKMVADNIVDSSDDSGLSVSCPSGEKPIVSFARNTKNAKPTSKDINTLKGVKGTECPAGTSIAGSTCAEVSRSTSSCPEAGTGGGYNFDPSKEF